MQEGCSEIIGDCTQAQLPAVGGLAAVVLFFLAQVYVALSRARAEGGLQIRGLRPGDIRTSRVASAFHEALRAGSAATFVDAQPLWCAGDFGPSRDGLCSLHGAAPSSMRWASKTHAA